MLLIVGVMLVLVLANGGAVWFLVVEVRHTVRDKETMHAFREFGRMLATQFRSMGDSLGQHFDNMATMAQTIMWPNKKKKEEERDVRD